MRRTLPDEQAEPDDRATPCEIEGDQRRLGLEAGYREGEGIRQPLSAGSRRPRHRGAIRRSSASARRADARSRPDSCCQPSTGASSAADPKPAMAATFSVPARKPLSCPPPRISRSAISNRSEAEDRRRPTPFGPPILWAERVSASTPKLGDVDRHLARPPGPHRVCIKPAMRVDDPGRLGDRLENARLVVGELDRDQNAVVSGPVERGARARPRSTIPSASTGMRSTASAGNRWPLMTQGCSVAPRRSRVVPGSPEAAEARRQDELLQPRSRRW